MGLRQQGSAQVDPLMARRVVSEPGKHVVAVAGIEALGLPVEGVQQGGVGAVLACGLFGLGQSNALATPRPRWAGSTHRT